MDENPLRLLFAHISMPHGSRVHTQPRAASSKLLSTIANFRRFLFGEAGQQVVSQGHRIDLREIESVLEGHDRVQECAVVLHEGRACRGHLVAYVVPVGAVPSPGFGNTGAIEHWRRIWDAAYSSAINNSATKSGILAGMVSCAENVIRQQELQETVERTAQRICALKPQRILEIGCGMGGILFRVSPHCKEYVGTDISEVALRAVQGNLLSGKFTMSQIRLRHQAADDFKGIAPDSFDMVVLNSVAQYFPNIHYLVDVLEKAVNATREGGVIFIGDVHNLPLSAGSSSTPNQNDSSVLSEDIDIHALRSGFEEQKLAVDPTFFAAFARRTLGISRVEVLLKRGHHADEVSRSRYDVLLHVGGENQEEVPVEWQRWTPASYSLASLQSLCGTPGDIFAFQGIPNKRLRADGVDPEGFWSFGEEAGFEVDLTWSEEGEAGSYDAVLRRGKMVQVRAARAVSDPMPWDAYANLPVRLGMRDILTSEWRQYLENKFPRFMIPAGFNIVESLPRTAIGEVDRRALQRKKSVFQFLETVQSIISKAVRVKTSHGHSIQEVYH